MVASVTRKRCGFESRLRPRHPTAVSVKRLASTPASRALAFASYADLLWLETPAPNLAEARAFADIIYSQYPGKPLAYSCSPAFD